MNKQRLQNVVRAIREGKEESFDMRIYIQPCGTPACALGHYAMRKDLQKAFYIAERVVQMIDKERNNIRLFVDVAEHFDITRLEASELFGIVGCGEAVTAKKAIAYIEDFIDRHTEAATAIEEVISVELQLT